MKIGTKSLLFGAHQFIIHPITVLLAWVKLYGLPNWKECICIFIHDLGYYNCENMEGKEGLNHPRFGAMIAKNYLDTWKNLYSVEPMSWKYHDLCLYHSRSLAADFNESPSALCWADKLCVLYDPWWFYLPRVILSEEIHEYRAEATKAGLITPDMSNREWYKWARERMIRKAYAQDARPPYIEGS
jgi:hypothetical protein